MSRAVVVDAQLLEAARDLAHSRIWNGKCEVCGARLRTGHGRECVVGRVLLLLHRLEELGTEALQILPEPVPVLPGDDPRIQVDACGWYVARGDSHNLRFPDYGGAAEFLNGADKAGAVPR